jgi:trans-aconitate methyltransferase
MSGEFSSTWLGLREPADAEARATELLAPLASRLGRDPADRDPADRELVIRDLGCGTGSLGRWLAPRLPGPQRWIMEDRDPALLAHAAASMVTTAADGSPVTVQPRQGDVTALSGADLAGTSLVTCSALLDILTAEELGSIAAALAAHGTTALFTLSVVGTVAFDPADELDASVAAAFNDHQRRTVAGRRLLGPDAPAAAAELLDKHGARVTVRPSPWRLGSERGALATEWLDGWTRAAAEQRAELPIHGYRRRRFEALAAGTVTITVGHQDLLAEFD